MSKKKEKKKKEEIRYYWEINITDALMVFTHIDVMAGVGAPKALRFQIQEEIKKIFPKLDRENEEDDSIDRTEKRSVGLTKRQMSAFCHGIIDFCNKDDTKGLDFRAFLEMAKKCKIFNHVVEQLHPEKHEDFEGELDGEDVVMDDEKSEEAGTTPENTEKDE